MRRPQLRVAEVARKKGLSMTRLMNRTELSAQTIRWLWRDDPSHDILLSTLQRVADVLDVPVTDLLGPPFDEPAR
jgi:transcriptional regulator with XRE-family HTH domain